MKRWLMCSALAAAMISRPAAEAAEGMFLLDQLPVERLKRSGLKIAPAELKRLSGAVVQVARGGTGSFVSPEGLLVTNHHVAYGCIARLGSRKEHLGLLDRGYLAPDRKGELPCPGYDLLMVQEVRDIDKEVRAAIKPKMSWAKQFEAVRLRQEELVAACEKDGRHICAAAALDGGRSYILSVYRRIRDVRLVFAPPKSLGKFGGDVDNWMYPRHTADFTFLRAYVGPGGEGAGYAAQNVPLKTPVHLEVSRHGVHKGSLVEVIGFPGRTSRHVTSHTVRFHSEEQLPMTLGLIEGLIGVINAKMKADPDIKRKYVSLESSLQNGMKYYQMSEKGMKRWKLLEQKLQAEQELAAGLAGDPRARARMMGLLGKIKGVLDRQRRSLDRFAALSRLSSWACPSMRMAYDIARWGREKAKPDHMRKEEQYKDKNVYRIMEASGRLEKEIHVEAEKALLLYFLKAGMKLPAAKRPRSMTWLEGWGRRELRRLRAEAQTKKVDFPTHFKATCGVSYTFDKLANTVAMLYGATRLIAKSDGAEEISAAVALRARLLEMNRKELAQQSDPLLQFAREVEAELHALREGPRKEVEQYLQAVLHPQWVEQVKKPSYPDANFTVRLTFGSVQDYTSSETGKTHPYLTSLEGLMDKDKGAYPFETPASLKAAFPERLKSPWVDPRLKDIPVNFTTTLDTTGGNSGSPVLDDRGRLVGLLFDGTPESILSDWQYLQREQRSICMDIRLALYLASVKGAGALLKEMGF